MQKVEQKREASARAWLRRWAGEPLLHFLMLGGLLFALLDDDGQAQQSVRVSQAQLDALQARFASAWRRPPDAQELSGLVEDHVREELAVREALALGIDRDDAVIRRLLRMKMEFLATDAALQEVPSEAQLQAFLDAHPELFRLPAHYSLRQIYLDPMHHGSELEKVARDRLRQLEGVSPLQAEGAGLGDPSQLPMVMDGIGQDELARRLGGEFAQALGELPVGRWVGPVRSGYGAHLVYLGEKRPGELPSLAQVRQQVLREWENAQRERALERFYVEVRQRYSVEVEQPSGAPQS